MLQTKGNKSCQNYFGDDSFWQVVCPLQLNHLAPRFIQPFIIELRLVEERNYANIEKRKGEREKGSTQTSKKETNKQKKIHYERIKERKKYRKINNQINKQKRRKQKENENRKLNKQKDENEGG